MDIGLEVIKHTIFNAHILHKSNYLYQHCQLVSKWYWYFRPLENTNVGGAVTVVLFGNHNFDQISTEVKTNINNKPIFSKKNFNFSSTLILTSARVLACKVTTNGNSK